ncbi:MAG: tilS [Betaproteobacteria bacterium]|nr:tilS [Betaproteobacteria bacterium]
MANTRKSPPNKTLLQRIGAVLGRHVRRGDRLVAGLSGGIDSVVMLDLLHRVAKTHRFELAALHVNHQINPRADRWASFCRAYCRRLGVALTVVKVRVPREASFEGAARAARYAAFAALPANFVAVAHNLDDQAETVLMQLLRGAGVKGASAMPVLRRMDQGLKIEPGLPDSRSSMRNPSVLRPLLEVTRAEIEAYAAARKLTWVDDDSNADISFDRNFVRHRLLPVIAERYPAYRQTLSRASRHFAEAAQLLDELARGDMQIVSGLKISLLAALPIARAKNALRYFLALQGVRMPNEARLAECIRQLQKPGGANTVIDLDGHQLRAFKGDLRVVRHSPQPAAGSSWSWCGESRLVVPELGAALVMKKSRGSGISLAKLQLAPVTVRLREGGERFRPDARRPRRSLKNLLQEARLPPWLRSRLPLLYCGETLVYVPDIGIDADFGAQAGEPGIEPKWEQEGAASPA